MTPDENVCVLYLGDADFKELRVLSSTGEWPTNIEDMLHLFQTVPNAVVRDDVCGKAVARCHVHVPPLSPADGSVGVGAALPSETRKLPRKSSEAEGAPRAGEFITEDVLAPVVLEVAPSMAGQDWFLCAACPGLSRFAEAVREGYLSCAVKSDKGVFVLYDGNAACGVQKIAGAADKDNKLGARGSQSLMPSRRHVFPVSSAVSGAPGLMVSSECSMSCTLAHNGINFVNDLFLGDTVLTDASGVEVSALGAGTSAASGASNAHAHIRSNIFDQAR